MKRKTVMILLLGALMFGGCGSGNEAEDSEAATELTETDEGGSGSERLVTTKYE